MILLTILPREWIKDRGPFIGGIYDDIDLIWGTDISQEIGRHQPKHKRPFRLGLPIIDIGDRKTGGRRIGPIENDLDTTDPGPLIRSDPTHGIRACRTIESDKGLFWRMKVGPCLAFRGSGIDKK